MKSLQKKDTIQEIMPNGLPTFILNVAITKVFSLLKLFYYKEYNYAPEIHVDQPNTFQ